MVIELSSSIDSVNAWKKKLLELGLPESEISRLKPGFDFMSGDSDSRRKILLVILNEYRTTWDDYSSWITKKLSEPHLLRMCTSTPDYLERIRFNGFSWQFLDDSGE